MTDDTLRMTPTPLPAVAPPPAPSTGSSLEPPPQQALPAPPEPSVLAASDPAAATDQITCPECGTTAFVTLNHRSSGDFCRVCDYPLFWVPTRVLLGRGSSDEASLRRLPGTLGRVTVASLECPHCDEPNAVTAEVCLRCGRSLHPAPAPPPRPAPVLVALEPEPEPEPEPEGWPWWVWALFLLVGGTAVGALVWAAVTRGG